MRSIEAIRYALRAIRGHPLRSALTVLGIVIGVAAVIALVSLGVSLQADVLGQVDERGEATRIYTWAGPEESGPGAGAGSQPVFTGHDLDRLAERPGVARVVPFGVVETTALGFGDDTVAAERQVIATTPAYLRGADLRGGRLFESGAREAVLTPAAASQFEENVTVGDAVTITLSNGSRRSAEVVGIRNDSAGLSAFDSGGARVYVPTDPYYTRTVQRPGGSERTEVYRLLVVEATDPTAVGDARENALAYLEEESDARRLLPREYVFQLRTSEDLLEQVRDLLNVLTGFVTSIAFISLLVAAIGIANVMLVSVTERTREIGIMKAVGAQNRDVLQLFLTEAVLLGAIGAVLGTLVGIGGGYLGARYIGFDPVYPVAWFAVAVVVGLVVGAVAGLYPAWRAARTDPIDALRYE